MNVTAQKFQSLYVLVCKSSRHRFYGEIPKINNKTRGFFSHGFFNAARADSTYPASSLTRPVKLMRGGVHQSNA